MPQIAPGSEVMTEEGMLVTRRSIADGVARTMVLPITWKQLQAWRKGTLIQEAMPDLTAEQREFLITGMTQEQWDQEMGEPDGNV